MEYIDKLRNTVETEYGLSFKSISAANRGFFGETWKLESNEGKSYFLKLDYWRYHHKQFVNSLPAVKFLEESGMEFVPPVLSTLSGELSFNFENGIAAVFDYREGENREDYPLKELFSRLSRVYALDVPPLDIPKESFGTEALESFESLRNRDDISEEIKATLKSKEDMIAHYAERLKTFSAICRRTPGKLYITHGDAGGNCLVGEKSFSIMDWDSVKLAAIERDCWVFICEEDLFTMVNGELEAQGVDHRLRPEFLCYYAYHWFFYYMTEYMNAFLSNSEKRSAMEEGVADYLENGWIHRQLKVYERLAESLI